MNLVSIIIPNYNHGKFLNQRIDSVLGQTYQNIEVIILDDASVDNSVEIINAYAKHPKISQIVLNEANSGSVFSQWFKGISLAKSKFIWIAESDDFCEPDFLEKVMQVFEGDRELGLVFTGSTAIDVHGNTLWSSPRNRTVSKWMGNDFIHQKMVNGNAVYNASMAVFNKDYMAQDLDLIKSYKFCGDWLFWILIAERSNVAYVGELLNYFRNHDKDLSGKAYQSGLYFREYKKILTELLKRNTISKKKMRKVLFLKLSLIASQIDNENIKEEILVSYKSELIGIECLVWKLEIAIWHRIKYRIKNI